MLVDLTQNNLIGNRNYGFHAELKKRFQREEVYESVYNHFNQVFSYMPLCAIVSKRILCMHGGISPHLKSLDDIRAIPLPLETAKTHVSFRQNARLDRNIDSLRFFSS